MRHDALSPVLPRTVSEADFPQRIVLPPVRLHLRRGGPGEYFCGFASMTKVRRLIKQTEGMRILPRTGILRMDWHMET
jgi:hypothetical protein